VGDDLLDQGDWVRGQGLIKGKIVKGWGRDKKKNKTKNFAILCTEIAKGGGGGMKRHEHNKRSMCQNNKKMVVIQVG
jgi:hypothetical protein